MIIGHNDDIAWGITNGGGDGQDLYILPKTAKLKIIEEKIQVKNSKAISFPVAISQYGPVISSTNSHIKKTGLTISNQMDRVDAR